MTIESFAMILGASAVLVIVGTLFFRRGREGTNGGRTERVSQCYDRCREDPKQIFYSCAAMCSSGE